MNSIISVILLILPVYLASIGTYIIVGKKLLNPGTRERVIYRAFLVVILGGLVIGLIMMMILVKSQILFTAY